jgi:predicted ATPase
MLTEIGVKNLGCFDDNQYSLKLNKLNVIVGPNNSGKSMFLTGLNMIRSYINSSPQINWNNEFCSLQSNREAVYGHDTSKVIELSVTYDNSSIAKLSIQNDKVVIDQFIKGGKAVGPLVTDEHKKLVSQIWYFHPERRNIPFQSEVGISSSGIQPISPSGENVIQFLLERLTAMDEKYAEVAEWITVIDDQNTLLKTPVVAKNTTLVTSRKSGKMPIEVNMSMQGSGINHAIAIIAGIFFSPPNATVIIEEPEIFLHRKSAEKLVDLFNYAVTNLSKQIIITTHSWSILRPYVVDIAKGTNKRGHAHKIARQEDFKLVEFSNNLGAEKMKEYLLKDQTQDDAYTYFEELGI